MFAATRERGQAIVVIAMGMIVLLLFAALAIDGGNAYNQRRVAQKASDASVLAGVRQMIEPGATTGAILGQVGVVVGQNDIDAANPRNGIHVWYTDGNGEVLGAYPELANMDPASAPPGGAGGLKVEVSTEFAAFLAGVIGRDGLSASAEARAIGSLTNYCGDWVLWANCDETSGSCKTNALNSTGSTTTIEGGGVHSNSGLHVTGSTVTLDPGPAQYGLPPSSCVGPLCAPPMGQSVAPQPMPVLYDYNDFLPGGYWWNDMCQGTYGARCHYINGSLGHSDVLNEGLYVVTGDIMDPQFTPGVEKEYTFVTLGRIRMIGQGIPAFKPFVGSSTTGGSKLFAMSMYQGNQNAVQISSNSGLNWKGIVYAPNGAVKMSGSTSGYSQDGQIFAWTMDLSGSTMQVTHNGYYCPPIRATITLIK